MPITSRRRLACLALLALAGCGREFDQAAWQKSGCDETANSDCTGRHDMLGSVEQRFPKGSKEVDVIRALGRPDSCELGVDTGHSSCDWATGINEQATFFFANGKVSGTLVHDIY